MSTTPISAPCTFARKLTSDTRGATAIEYAVIASVIGLMLLGATSHLRASLEMTYDGIAAALSDEPNPSTRTR